MAGEREGLGFLRLPLLLGLREDDIEESETEMQSHQ